MSIMDYCSYLPNESYESVVNEIERYLNKVAEADVWLRENPLEFEWGGTSMIEDKEKFSQVSLFRHIIQVLSN